MLLGIILVGIGALILLATMADQNGGPPTGGIFLGLLGIPLGIVYWRAGFGLFGKRESGYKYGIIACCTMLIILPLGSIIGILAMNYLNANKEVYSRNSPYAEIEE